MYCVGTLTSLVTTRAPNMTNQLATLSLISLLGIALVWANELSTHEERIEAAINSIPGAFQSLSSLLNELDSKSAGKERAAPLADISELQAERLASSFKSLQGPDFRPPMELELVEKKLNELFGSPCARLVEQFQVPLEILDPTLSCHSKPCRMLKLCRLVRAAFQLEFHTIGETAQLIAPRARASARMELHQGLEEEQESMALRFSRLPGGANLARLIDELMRIQSVKGHEELKLNEPEDVAVGALAESYQQIYENSRLATKYRYVVEPFLRLSLYEPCKLYLEEIRDFVSACTPISNSYACTAAKVCQLLRISYREKRSNWTNAENHIKEEIQKSNPLRDETNFALSKNQADNYATLKMKLKSYEKERNKYKYY